MNTSDKSGSNFTNQDLLFVKKKAAEQFEKLRSIGFDKLPGAIDLQELEGELCLLMAELLVKYPDQSKEQMDNIFVRSCLNWVKTYIRDLRCKHFSKKRRGPAAKFNPDIVEFRKLYYAAKDNGRYALSVRAIARFYGVDEETVRRFIKKSDLIQRVKPTEEELEMYAPELGRRKKSRRQKNISWENALCGEIRSSLFYERAGSLNLQQ